MVQQSSPGGEGSHCIGSVLYIRTAVLRVLGNCLGWNQEPLRQASTYGQLCYSVGCNSITLPLHYLIQFKIFIELCLCVPQFCWRFWCQQLLRLLALSVPSAFPFSACSFRFVTFQKKKITFHNFIFTIYFQVAIEMVTYWDEGFGKWNWMVYKNIVVVAFGLLALVFGSKSALEEIFQSTNAS